MKRMADLGKGVPTRIDSDIIEDYSNLPKGIGIYEISGPLFFGSAKEFCEIIKQTGFKSKVLIISMLHVPFMDVTGMHNFKEALKILNTSGIKIVLSGVNPDLRNDLDKNRISFLVGKANIFELFNLALERATEIVKSKTE